MKTAATLALAASIAGCAGNEMATAADPVRGERAYQKCYACHSIEPNENDLTGPSLHAIVGRPIAAAVEFEYSAEMRAFARAESRWTAELLDRFIADPEALVPGTDMGFGGIADASERADLIAYLRANRHRTVERC